MNVVGSHGCLDLHSKTSCTLLHRQSDGRRNFCARGHHLAGNVVRLMVTCNRYGKPNHFSVKMQSRYQETIAFAIS